MDRIPVRLDFGGGWLDVPRLAVHGAYIVNMAISPLIRKDGGCLRWCDTGGIVHAGSGLGTSAAWHILNGHDVMEMELGAGCGWQDPAILCETGLCCWASGESPVLVDKDAFPKWLAGRLALYWTGQSHTTADIAGRNRCYNTIANASVMAYKAMRSRSVHDMAAAMEQSYRAQREEGMAPLPVFGLSSKYCGAGWGGYAVYLFETRVIRDRAVERRGLMAVEPYTK